ncbi:molybdenum cofactor guanylyltransferase [Neobacillus jeddahensis]|uniref:molybdenum cofactor guanylyltransferase n=1 Tax=Neobacillus jeddahensis TaxID=1461580 RepID=UPI00058AFF56|nr:molybdenum cofactor guanylyltransferase [Neobacillus jeddahensis]
MKAAAIILAGGKSSRMGTNKALLKLNEKTNIERMVDTLKALFDDIIIVTNDSEQYEFLGVKIVADHYPGMGPLAGVHAGLQASAFDVNFFVACDMPFISGELAETLVSHIDDYDAVIPVINGKQQPLYSIFHKRVTGVVADCIEAGQLRMKHLLDQVQVFYVTEKELPMYSATEIDRIFFNMNHPNEYEDAKKWAEIDKGE